MKDRIDAPISWQIATTILIWSNRPIESITSLTVVRPVPTIKSTLMSQIMPNFMEILSIIPNIFPTKLRFKGLLHAKINISRVNQDFKERLLIILSLKPRKMIIKLLKSIMHTSKTLYHSMEIRLMERHFNLIKSKHRGLKQLVMENIQEILPDFKENLPIKTYI